jgi:hypothetical protein
MIKSWKKKEFKKLAEEKKIAKKKNDNQIWRKKTHGGWSCKKKKQFKKWPQTKKIVIKRMETKFKRLKK